MGAITQKTAPAAAPSSPFDHLEAADVGDPAARAGRVHRHAAAARRRQLTRPPLVVTATCFPAIATRTCLGENASRTVTSDPRAAVAVFLAVANGAPQRALQHHDESTSGTVADAVESVAFGGPASASAAISATTEERYRGLGRRSSHADEKITPLRRNLM